MATIQELLRSIGLRGTKSNVEGFTANFDELAFAFATDTLEFGIYTGGDWEWVGSSGSSVGGYTEGASVYHNANQSIDHNTVTAIALNSEHYDTDSIHSTVTNNSRLTCQTSGKYWIHGLMQYAANSTGIRIAQIRLDGTTILARDKIASPSASTQADLEVSRVYDLTVGQYVELAAFQTSGIGLNVERVSDYSPIFEMQRIG